MLSLYKINRLTRNQKDFFITGLFQKYNLAFISATQIFKISSAAGGWRRNIVLEFVKFEHEMIAVRAKEGQRSDDEKIKKGGWNDELIPIGYGYSSEEMNLKINPKEAKIEQLDFETYLKEKSLAKEAKKLNALGYKTKTQKTK